MASQRVPLKLRKKIQSFINTVELTENSEERKLANDLIEKNVVENKVDSIAKRPPPNHFPPAVRYIHQNNDLYLKYQSLCLDYEEAKSAVTLNCVRTFINIKNPSRIEHNVGISLMYLAAFLDKIIMLAPK